MAALYSHTTRATGTTLTAAIYNADHENHITNGIPGQLDDYSANAAQMQSTADPGESGSESLATSLAGELERIRFILKEMGGNRTQWYTSGWEIGSGLLDANGNELLKFAKVASAVNELTATNAATGSGPILSATGGDSNIDINLTPKGTGDVVVNGDLRVTGATQTQNSKSENYTLVAADANNIVLHPAADTNDRTFTIPANASVAYAVGTYIVFVNEVNSLTIAITSDTLALAGTSTTGSRTLAANGIAVAQKVTSTKWIINGTGLT